MSQPTSDASSGALELVCDLCIVGAGIAGLNALFAATRYLSKQQKVVLVDVNPGVGGMWLHAYDYVRLHQPHPLFTAGNVPWTSGKEPSHLATRPEIVSHLVHCLETCRQRVTLDERYGYAYRSHDENGAARDEVLVLCDAIAPGKPGLRIKAKKLVKAFGYNVKAKDALRVSSAQVRSVSPDKHDLFGADMGAPDAPVYVMGGGKTAMDTAYALLTRAPQRKVSMVIGQGTVFGCRDKLYPAGVARYFRGDTPIASFLDLAKRFDGRNEREILPYFLSRYGVSLVPDPRRFLLGLLSEHENDTIRRGARELIKDYFVDVVDRDGKPTLLLKSGATRTLEPGSVIVNCTGYLFRAPVDYEPYVSPSGKVVSVQVSSSVHVLSTCAAYLLVHLSYLDKLRELPLYEADLVGLFNADRDVAAAALSPHTLYNATVILGAVPSSVLDEFGADLERWFPLPRRLIDGITLLAYQKRNPDHLRRTLDVVRERFGVRLGPLAHVARVSPVSHAARV